MKLEPRRPFFRGDFFASRDRLHAGMKEVNQSVAMLPNGPQRVLFISHKLLTGVVFKPADGLSHRHRLKSSISKSLRFRTMRFIDNQRPVFEHQLRLEEEF